MAGFTAAFTSGATLETWVDAASGASPARSNPHPGLSHKRFRAVLGVQVVITMTDAALGAAPLDTALGGRLFIPWRLETPDDSILVFSNPAGQSSVQRFTPLLPGHYTFGILRPLAGAVILHLDAK